MREDRHVAGREDSAGVGFVYETEDIVIRGFHYAAHGRPALLNRVIQAGMAVQHNIAAVMRENLKDDVLRFMDECADCGELIPVHEELGRLDGFHWNRQQLHSRAFLEHPTLCVIEGRDMRGVKAEFRNQLRAGCRILSPNVRFKFRNDLNFTGLALMQDMRLAVDGDAAHAVQAGDKRVIAGGVRADFLVLIEGEQGHADGVILRQRPADDLPILTSDLFLERKHLGLGDILHGFLHFSFLPCGFLQVEPHFPTHYAKPLRRPDGRRRGVKVICQRTTNQ